MKKLIFLASILFLVGCEEIFFDAVPENTPSEIFEQTWQFADQEYTFFEYKNIDWNQTYQDFKPLIREDMIDEELFEVLADMLYLLRDGHVNLRSPFDRSRNWSWFLDAPPNFNYDLLEREYFKTEQQFVGSFTLYDFKDVGYFRYASFSNSVSSQALNYIINTFKDHKGIIIDVRDNGGGSLGNAYAIARRFASKKQVVAKEYTKNGPGHNDLSEAEELTLSPPSESPTFTKPVIVLTNRSSYSATTFFTQFMRELPHVTIVGDTTGGGGGAPTFTELANGWDLRVSSTLTTSPDGFNIENGIPPDVQIDLSKTDEDAGKDSMLEEALRLLRQ